ncbi:RHS repeat domain-containing protein, partial [Woodsholea maritima]|uniref:hypothetical protein n=1 Tax=Woodsholea maritima TaxID=240237 RepID=UPI001F364288
MLTTTQNGGSDGDRTFSRLYDDAGRLYQEINALGHSRTYRYNSAGQVAREDYSRTDTSGVLHYEAIGYDYDLAGQLLEQTQLSAPSLNGPYTLATGSIKTQMTYNAYGDVVARGINGVNIENFEYDRAGRVTRTNQGDGIYDLVYHDALGQQTLTIASDGRNMSTLSRSAALGAFGGASGVMGTLVSDLVATITVYDKRGQAIKVIEPQRERAEGIKDMLTTLREYNAFGEASKETNAAGHTITYMYNTMGRMVEKQLPSTSHTNAAGVTSASTPQEYYHYDTSGRLVGYVNAKGARTSYAYLAGTGYNGSQGQILSETDAQNFTRTNHFNNFGEVVRITNKLGYQTQQSFDRLGRLASVTQAENSLTEYYQYDELGQRTKRWNNAGLGQDATHAEETHYDIQGRVVRHKAFGGDITTTHYSLKAGSIGFGLNSQLYWEKSTTMANGKAMVERTDVFEREFYRSDLGGHITTTSYDGAGRVILKDVDSTWFNNQYGDVEYSYYNTNRVSQIEAFTGSTQVLRNVGDNTGKSLSDPTSDLERTERWQNVIDAKTIAAYSYDIVGNQISERLSETGLIRMHIQDNWSWEELGVQNDQIIFGWVALTDFTENVPYEEVLVNSSAQFDALGRMTQWSEAGYKSTRTQFEMPAASVSYQYDLNGNVRHTQANFKTLDSEGNVTGSGSHNYWYDYDHLDRVTLSKGALVNGSLVRGSTGAIIGYDAEGQRAFVINGSDNTREDYSYDKDGRLKGVKINNSDRVSYGYDALGRMNSQLEKNASGLTIVDRKMTFNTKGQLTNDTSFTRHSDKTRTTISTFDYGTGTNYALGSALSQSAIHKENNVQKSTSTTTYEFDWYDSAKQTKITYSAQGQTHETRQAYHLMGGQAWLASASVLDGKPYSVNYINNVTGQVVIREQVDNLPGGQPLEFWYRYGGKEMGAVGNNGGSDQSYNASINDRQTTPGQGPFRNGASSGTSYADFDQGLSPINSYNQGSGGGVYTVQNGDTLQ